MLTSKEPCCCQCVTGQQTPHVFLVIALGKGSLKKKQNQISNTHQIWSWDFRIKQATATTASGKEETMHNLYCCACELANLELCTPLRICCLSQDENYYFCTASVICTGLRGAHNLFCLFYKVQCKIEFINKSIWWNTEWGVQVPNLGKYCEHKFLHSSML